jgi:general secretion pathway protein G
MSGANTSGLARSHQTMSGANTSAVARCHPIMTRSDRRGFTLIELMVSIFIIAILVGLALPLAKNSIKREREFELRQDLRDMRTAIDKYKDASDRGLIMAKVDTEGYPETLQVLVDGVQIVGQVDKKLKLLRRIPKDPMTNSTEWGLRSYQDDPKNTAWGGQDVFDVYTKSGGTGLDGIKYKDW